MRDLDSTHEIDARRLRKRFAQIERITIAASISVTYRLGTGSVDVPVRFALLGFITICSANVGAAQSLGKLADDFWTWRSRYAPFTGDDVNRLERLGGVRDWSRASIEQRRKDLAEFAARWKTMNPAHSPVPEQVDYRLIGSALSRVRWELEVNPRWKRDPNFYVEQTLTALAEALTVPPP